MKLKTSQVIALHIICWLVYISIPVLFIASQSADGNLGEDVSVRILLLLIYPAVFYLHSYLLLNKLFFKRKYILYFASMVLIIAAVTWLKPFDQMMHRNALGGRGPGAQMQPPPGMMMPPPPGNIPQDRPATPGPKVDIISLALLMIVIAASISMVVVRRWLWAVRRAAQAESHRSKAELSSLKAQINPHFLFNTLNNIYSLAVTNDEHTAESIMMLSNIMRYVTDEATQEMVPLQNEADCIKDFIELNRLRLGSKIRFNYSIGGDMEGKQIAPLLLITFVENVFKYGVSNHEVCEINIYLVADKKKITFFCQNKMLPKPALTESTGVGISNAKKRLEFLYPGKHELIMTDHDGYYTVSLIIHTDQ